LDDVKEALMKAGVGGMTVGEIRGFGHEKGHTERYRGVEFSSEFLSKVKLQVLVTDEMAAQVVGAILDSAHSGKLGDGKIFVTEIEEVVRIRTGERGPEAI
jgi:nitrogen regulatory protein P-II 1